MKNCDARIQLGIENPCPPERVGVGNFNVDASIHEDLGELEPDLGPALGNHCDPK